MENKTNNGKGGISRRAFLGALSTVLTPGIAEGGNLELRTSQGDIDLILKKYNLISIVSELEDIIKLKKWNFSTNTPVIGVQHPRITDLPNQRYALIKPNSEITSKNRFHHESKYNGYVVEIYHAKKRSFFAPQMQSRFYFNIIDNKVVVMDQ